MNDFGTDITRRIISIGEIRQRIGSIFPDSVILDNQFNFVSISQNILDATGYNRFELLGTSVSRLANTYDLRSHLEEKLRSGFFEEETLDIASKDGGKIVYSISGFYFGLITDINGLIVLKFKNLDEISLTYERHETKINELDNFVYLSAHALRGPLATIKGLINLSKSTKDINEINLFVQQMETFADRLDDKLHRLIFFAESDKGYESYDQEIALESICKTLAAEINEVSIRQSIHFKCEAFDKSICFQNGEVTLSLLRNLVSFFCQQPTTTDNLLLLDAHANASAMEIILRAKGFLLSESIREKIKATNFGYSEILSYPELINCYAAKKAIFRLKGSIQFILTSSVDVVVLITFPNDMQGK
jgi:signal transduction histidine kinase